MVKEKKEDKKLDMSSYKDKASAIKAALDSIRKEYGEGAAFEFADHPLKDVEAVSTGSIGLDVALGVGGLPRGRVVEIYGLESSGKTTLSLHCIAEMQKLGGKAAFIDAEHALDPVYAAKLGVQMDDLVIAQPESGEKALGICETLVASGGFDIIVVDSVAALVPQAEIDGDMGDSHVGLQARLMSQALRKLTALVAKSNCILIFINQVRMKIGVMYGNPETTTGGNALKFYSSVRLEVRKVTAIKDGDNVIGNRTRVKVVKNKVAPPFREVEFDINFGKGINSTGDLLDLSVNLGLVEKSGAWYSYLGERIGQGAQNSMRYIQEHDDVRDTLLSKVKAHYGIKT